MEPIYVAQLDGNQVVGVSQLNRGGFTPAPNLIEIDSFDTSLLGKIYDSETGAFTEPSSKGGDE